MESVLALEYVRQHSLWLVQPYLATYMSDLGFLTHKLGFVSQANYNNIHDDLFVVFVNEGCTHGQNLVCDMKLMSL